MRTFIEGATNTGLSVASKSVEARSSQVPCAIFDKKSADAGATRIISADLDSSICPISASAVKSNNSV